MKKGKIVLVGAGPGAADLLTLRAIKHLQNADVVYFDRLVSQEVLDLLPSSTRCLFAGKVRGRNQNLRQDSVSDSMIKAARSGLCVVRLKGGDPFVFGRGGEEVLAARMAGIDVEVVPGLSSCLSAPALEGIPVTFRGLASSFGVFTGRSGLGLSAQDWRAAATCDTAIFLMGVDSFPEIVSELLDRGRDPNTPLAFIHRAGQPSQCCLRATLATAGSLFGMVEPPSTLVVGPTVNVLQNQVMSILKAG